jgi:site-specific DNA recombinase
VQRIAGYARLSVTTEESVSITEQVRQINAECDRRGWPTPVVFVDEGVSGSKDIVRPKRDELERRIAVGDFDAVLVKSVDRLARSVLDFHRIAAQAKKRNTTLVVIETGLDTSKPEGSMMLGLLATFAAFEAEAIARRVRTSNAALRREGRTRGGPVPFGLRNVRRDDAPGMWREVDPEEAAVVRRIADSLLAGGTLRGMADDLNREGVPSPRASDAVKRGRAAPTQGNGKPLRWDRAAVRRVVMNPAVAGMERALGDVIRDDTGLRRVSAEAILDLDEWRRVVAVVEGRAAGDRSRTRHADRPLLERIAVCAACGGYMRRATTRGFGNYVCSQAAKSRCDEPSAISTRRLDAYVEEAFRHALGDLPIMKSEAVADESSARKLTEVRAEITDTAAEFARATGPTLSTLATRMAALRATEASLQEQASATPFTVMVPSGETYGQAWERMAGDVVGRRQLLADSLTRVVVHRSGPLGRRTPIEDRITVHLE